MALAQHFDLQEAGFVFPLRLARELIAPGNPERVFHRGVAGRRGLDMGMGQRLQAQLELSDGEVCHCSTRLPGAPRRQRSSAPWRACSSASALCANSIAFAWYWRNDFMAWNHGTPVAKSTSDRLLSVLQSRTKASRSPDDPESAGSASSRHCVYVIPNGEGMRSFPLRSRCDDHGPRLQTEWPRYWEGKRRQDSPRSKPKAAERNVQIHLQTVRTRRLLPRHPHTFDRTRPTKSNLSYMKNYSYFTPARELRNFRLNVFGPFTRT